MLVKNIVHNFLVQFGSQCNSTERLSFSTCEDRRTVRAWQRTNLAPDRTDFCSCTTIQTFAFIQDTTTHSFFFHIVVVAVNHTFFFFQLFFSELCFEFFANAVESILTFMFVSIA